MWRCLRVLMTLLLGGVMVACQTPKRPDIPNPLGQGWQNNPAVYSDHQQWFNNTPNWKLTAKVGISAPNLKESANLVWQANDSGHVIRLFGPLGVGSIRLEFDSNGATLTDSKGNAYQSDEVEALLMDVTGWPIPINDLKHWLFMLPEPNSSAGYLLNEQNQFAALSQKGWLINYDRYTPSTTQRPSLPKKMVAVRSINADGIEQNVTVRLIIRSLSPLP